ncbi:MAG: acyl-CoA dehydrogenase family protein [Polyangiaceae bacterium]
MRRPPFSADHLDVFFEDRHRALGREVGPIAMALDAEVGHDAARTARRMGELGLYRHVCPRPGEKDIDVRALVTIREALGYAHTAADSIFAVQGLASYPVALEGTDAQRAAYADAVVRGERVGGFGLTEPNAGSDVAGLETRATKDGDGWVLEGDKTLISNVGIADYFVIFARAIGAGVPESKAITAFLVDASTPGVTTALLPMSSPHPLGSIALRAARLPDAARLGAVGRGMALALRTLETFRISVGAAANGMASRALDESIARTTTRKQFGAPLSDQQMVRAYLADMATELDAARLLVARAAHVRDTKGGRPVTEVAMAKLFATEHAQTIIDRAVQLHGGSGVLTGSVVEALYRDVRPLRIYEGTSEIQRLVIARALVEPKPS